MEAKSLPSWRDASDDLVTQCDSPDGCVWILGDEAARVIGKAVVQRQGQPWGRIDAERAEAALCLPG
jgi:hypothetical protein